VAAQQRAAAASASTHSPSSSRGAGLSALPPAEAVAVVESYLFNQQRLKPAKGGRSALPSRTVLTHPGVYESAQSALLNEVRCGVRMGPGR